MMQSSKLESFLQPLDPISLLLSFNPIALSAPEHVERGPRYNSYAALRESKLRRTNDLYDNVDEYQQAELLSKQPISPPVKKQVSFVSNVPRRKGTTSGGCNVAQSVPDFSAVLRREKENRKPPPRVDLTPPPPGKGGQCGSRSASSVVEKKKSRVQGMMMSARKSYASLDELKGLSSIAASAINGGCSGRVVRSTARNVYGFRQL